MADDVSPKKTEAAEGFARRDVERALQNVLASDQFSGSAQLSSFLTYIVTKKLDGNEGDIKAYSIAVDALGRSDDFDPQENAFVRVAAGRLRQLLMLYNTSEHAEGENIRIELEPGSYVPNFVSINDGVFSISNAITSESDAVEINEPATAAQTAPDATLGMPESAQHHQSPVLNQPPTFASKWWRWVVVGIGLAVLANLALALYNFMRPPTVVQPSGALKLEEPPPIDVGIRPRIRAFLVLPDEPYPDWYKSGEIAEALGVIMARFDDYQFVGSRIIKDQQAAEPDPKVDYELMLTAYRRDDSVRHFAKLVNLRNKSVLWSTERQFSRPETLAGRNVPDIIGRAYSPVASPYGVLYANLSNAPNQRSELNCVINGYQYFYSKTSEKHAVARACAERLVDQGTSLPSIFAVLAFLYLDEFRENRNRRARDPVAAAAKAAERAVALGPQSARAHQALFAVHKVRGNRKLAKAAAEKAISLNPYDADILGDYAAWLISVGDLKKGREYLTRVEGLLDARPAWLDFYRFLGAELSRDFESANDISLMMDIRRSPLLAVAVAIGSYARGDLEKTNQALKELVQSEPGFRDDPMSQFINRGFDEKIAKQLVDKLKAAGLDNVTAG